MRKQFSSPTDRNPFAFPEASPPEIDGTLPGTTTQAAVMAEDVLAPDADVMAAIESGIDDHGHDQDHDHEEEEGDHSHVAGPGAARASHRSADFDNAANAISAHMPDHAVQNAAAPQIFSLSETGDRLFEGHIHVRHEDGEGYVAGADAVTSEGDGPAAAADGAAALLGDMADYLTTGYWTRNGSTIETRYHNVGTTGNDPNDGVLYFNVSGYADDADGLTAERADLVREAFNLFGATLGIDFQETTSTDTSTVDFFFSDDEGGAYAGSSYWSNGEINYSYLNIAAGWSGGTSTYDDYTFQTILHEIGHALGLGHQGPYNGSASYGTDNQFENDSWQASMMSYFSQTQNTSINASYEFLQTPMAVDWIALNELYGSQGYGTFNAFTEDTVWGFNTTVTSDVSDVWASFAEFGNRTASTIVDGGGIDTLDLSGYANNTLINLATTDRGDTAPSLSNIGGRIGNLALAEGTIIENAVGGAGSETFIGNAADNTMTGNGGDDTFVDSAGADTYLGGAGTDTVTFAQAFADFTFTISGAFLQVIDVAVDLVESTIEWLSFDGVTYSWAEIADGLSPNNAPVAVNDAASVAEDASVSGNVLSNDTDLDGDTLSVVSVNGQTAAVGSQIALASGALVTLNADGTYSYDTNGAFDNLNDGETGGDSFTYQVSDGLGGLDQATVTISVDGITGNAAPVAVNDAATITEEATASGNVLSNDSDANSDTLSIVAVNGNAGAVGQQITLSSGALVTLNSDGSYDYDPNGAFDALDTGETATDGFSYVVSDGQGGTDTASVAITIEGLSPPVVETAVLLDFETAPLGTFAGLDGIDATGLSVEAGTAMSGARYAQSDGFTLTATGQDFDLGSATFRSVDGRVRITVEAWDDGVLVGTRNVNIRRGRDADVSFDASFDSIDELRVTSNNTFNIDDLSLTTRTVDGPGGVVNPIAENDAFQTTEADAVAGNLLANDSDADGGTLTLVSVEGDSSGTVTLASGAQVSFASDGSISYDPNGAYDTLYDGQTAQDSFSYAISDGQGGTAQAIATVSISGSGTPPVTPTEITLDFEGTVTGDTLEEDGFIFSDVATTTAGLGVASGSQAVQSVGDSITFGQLDGENFDLDQAVVTAVSGRNVRLQVEAYDDGVLIATDTIRIRDNRETTINFDDASFGDADEIVLTASGGLILDDVLVIA